ncbi:MAG: hypothetical protein DLM67_07080 [Candidatus Nephthysia bennettiae]|nr:MAG: hypothetical protein DLM67_07080 [Candidatus Dormibacteraeota bacterium]
MEVRPEEGVLVEARARQRSPGFRQIWRQRQVVEHRVARMVQLGMRQARYRGRQKTLFQALITAPVDNLTLIAGDHGYPYLLRDLGRALEPGLPESAARGAGL